MVLKDRGANEQPLRGMVMEYRSETSEWRLQYDGEEELVDLDMLNVRLAGQHATDAGAMQVTYGSLLAKVCTRT